jgi:hypothetical protein
MNISQKNKDALLSSASLLRTTHENAAAPPLPQAPSSDFSSIGPSQPASQALSRTTSRARHHIFAGHECTRVRRTHLSIHSDNHNSSGTCPTSPTRPALVLSLATPPPPLLDPPCATASPHMPPTHLKLLSMRKPYRSTLAVEKGAGAEAAPKEESTPVMKEKRKFSPFLHRHHRSTLPPRSSGLWRAGTASSGCIRRSSSVRKPSFQSYGFSFQSYGFSFEATGPPSKPGSSPSKEWFISSLKGFFGPAPTAYRTILTHAAT